MPALLSSPLPPPTPTTIMNPSPFIYSLLPPLFISFLLYLPFMLSRLPSKTIKGMGAHSRSKSNLDAAESCRRWSSNKQQPSTPGRFSSSSPARLLLRRIKANVAKTLSLFSASKGATNSDPITPFHFIPPRDSHHYEALEDCIEFINTSQRKSL